MSEAILARGLLHVRDMEQRRPEKQILAFRANKSWATARRVAKVQPSMEESGIMVDRDIRLDALLELRRQLKTKK
jgi:hypothetical protein